MRATGFSGYANIMGHERRIVFDDGHFAIEALSMEEAQLLVETLERSSPAMARVGAAVTLAGTQTGRTSTAAPQPSNKPRSAPAQPEPLPEPNADELAEVEAEAKAEREAIQAESREAEERIAREDAEKKAKAKAEAKAKSEADAKTKAEADAKSKADADKKAKADADAKAKAEAEARARAKAKAEADAKAERGNKQEDASGSIDHDETKEDTRPKKNGASSIPAEVRSAKHLRAVLAYCTEELHLTKPDEIVKWCSDHASDIEVVARVGDRLEERVGRALEVMAAN